MSFPTSPTNGQTAVVNGINYEYASASGSWTRVLSGGGGGGGAAPVFTFGGTGTPIAGTDVTPWIMVRSAATNSLLALTVKTPPTDIFSVTIKKSSDSGVTFATTIGTVIIVAGAGYTTTTSVSGSLSIGDLLSCDINSVSGAADWNCQLETA